MSNRIKKSLAAVVFGSMAGWFWFCLQFLLQEVTRDIPTFMQSLLVFVSLPLASAVSAFVCVWPSEQKGSLETRCRNCGHILRGLTEPRCPECGEPI